MPPSLGMRASYTEFRTPNVLLSSLSQTKKQFFPAGSRERRRRWERSWNLKLKAIPMMKARLKRLIFKKFSIIAEL